MKQQRNEKGEEMEEKDIRIIAKDVQSIIGLNVVKLPKGTKVEVVIKHNCNLFTVRPVEWTQLAIDIQLGGKLPVVYGDEME